MNFIDERDPILYTLNIRHLCLECEPPPHRGYSNLYKTVSSKRYKLEYVPIEDLDQSLMCALWVAKGPTFCQVENNDFD